MLFNKIKDIIDEAMSIRIVKDAYEYMEKVLDDDFPAGWEIKAQCKKLKQLWDIDQYNEDFKYYFDLKEMKKICGLLKLLNFATGYVAGKPIYENLSPYQSFLIVNLFGWRYKDRPYKFKYNDITVFVARKNAKTATIGIIYILLMLTDQDYSEFYSICLNRELAGEIRKSMVQILGASPHIKKHFKVSESFLGKLECKITKSFFQARVAEAGKNNSIRPSAFVCDEMGNMQARDNFDAMASGQKSVLNPLKFRTTTRSCVCN